jgi:dTDP-4-amino-4,6-dideoxygalactose transaminase/nucleoside-diphosphate-sugar epimerase
VSQDGFIPFQRPSIGEDEIEEVTAALRSGWLTTGPRTAQFEEEFRARVGAAHALAVSSGSAALHLALAALGIGPGDEVITTPLTFCATVLEILHAGATPVLADIGPDGNIAPDSAASRVTGRTRAIVPVHLGGLPCRMDALWELAREHRLHVIEDAAHAAGAQYHGWPIGCGDPTAGARSDAVAFSFYATKNLTTGEGGMVTTHDAALAERMRVLRTHGISKDAWTRGAGGDPWFYEVREPGFKYNLSDIQSAIGLHQLRKLEKFVAIRAEYAGIYDRAFADLPEIELPPRRDDCRHAWHLYVLRLNLGRLRCDRGEFIRMLHERGVGASVHFIPISVQPFFKEHAELPRNHCPRAMELYPRLVSLPLYPALTLEQVERVARAVREIVQSAARASVWPAAPAPAGRLPDPLSRLLGSQPVRAGESRIRSAVSSRSFLVTGAAGSIGSELCRELARFEASRLVAFDQAESELYKLCLELESKYPGVEVAPELADIRDRGRVEEAIRRHRPDAVIHAAAYKHVPMLEAHAIEAARNNVLGTWYVAEAARRNGVSAFLLISSDKAVNPAGLMGMTKRAAELIAGSMPGGGTRFVCVRFGNVFGSNGSVAPLFQEQIASGGPVTVTHPEARRFFMTIRQAVSLILKAFAMGRAGTFVLDMGEPVAILELAQSMIRLAGLEPDRDIEIRITGLRPGEKLVEELFAEDEVVRPTGQEGVKAIQGAHPGYNAMAEWIERLSGSLARRDSAEVEDLLRDLVEAVAGNAG